MQFDRYEGNLTTLNTDLVALGVCEGSDWSENAHLSALNDALDGLIKTVADEEGFEGKDGQSIQLHTHGRVSPSRIHVYGLGNASCFDPRVFAARTIRAARTKGLADIALVSPSEAADAGTLLVEGTLQGHYTYDRLKTRDVKPSKVATIRLVGTNPSDEEIQTVVRKADGVNLVRDLVNDPPIIATPSYLAEHGRRIAKENGLDCKIMGKSDLESMGMRLILAVSAGSSQEPFLIHLTYTPKNATKDTPSVGIVGKGLTFDAGGLCLKPPGSMADMKLDMAGGAAVLGMMQPIDAVQPDVIVHALIPTSENLLGESAYKPGDVIKSYNGKTVEIINTDAEGRLIMADALHYATELGCDEIINLATLTGAICVALGNESAGIFSNNDAMRQEVIDSATEAGESVWGMPLDQRLKKQLKSNVADFTNCGERWGGAITAALFLSEFVGDTNWTHIDLAGPSYAAKDRDLTRKGGTGFGVTTLLSYLKRAGQRLG